MINLYRLKFFACHGALPHELTTAQEFWVDVRVKVDLSEAGQSDRVEDTIHYGKIASEVERVMMGPSVHLLETLAYRIRAAVWALDSRIDGVAIAVRKVVPPIGMPSDGAEVMIDYDD